MRSVTYPETGELKEAFLAVVNTQPADERLIAKNAERVVTARLRDARFFWEADRKIKLEGRLDRLHTIVFHKKAGSYRDKAERPREEAAEEPDFNVRRQILEIAKLYDRVSESIEKRSGADIGNS